MSTTEIVEKTRAFCKDKLEPIARDLDVEGRFPTELVKPMAELGLWGLNYPAEYGGGAVDSPTSYQVVEELAKASAGVSLTLHVHWMATDILANFGSAEQKAKYLPALLSGEKIAAFCISETHAGSDAAAMRASADKTETGWKLDGPKWFCTNGGLADIYFVGVKTDQDAGAKGISVFLVEKGTPGFEIGQPEEKMGCRSSVTTGLLFRDCLAPDDALIGKVNEGFKVAMSALVGGRLGMAAMGLGIAQAAMEEAARYANRRQAFGKPLAALFAVQEMLADMYVKIEAARPLVRETAAKRDSGKDYALESSVAKLFVAQVVNETCHKAVQVFGGHGYMKYNPVERYARDGRLMDIGVGASEVLKMVVGGYVAKAKGK